MNTGAPSKRSRRPSVSTAGDAALRAARFRKPALAAISVYLVLAATEFAVVTLDVAPRRPAPLLLWNPGRDAEMREDSGAFRADPRWLWSPRPGAELEGERINPGGYRGPLAEDEPGAALRIAALGDSSTFGLGVPERDAWPRRLETHLRERGVAVEVLNFGVIGFTAVQGASYYVGRVREERPDLVIAAFGAVNEQVPAPAGMSDSARILALKSPKHRLRSFLERYATFRLLQAAVGAAPPPPTQGSDERDRWRRRVPLQDFEVALRALYNAVEHEDGARLILVNPPRRAGAEQAAPLTRLYSGAVVRIGRELEIPTVNVNAALSEAERELADNGSPLFLDSWHPSPAGHDLYARTLADAILAAGLHRHRRPRD